MQIRTCSILAATVLLVHTIFATDQVTPGVLVPNGGVASGTGGGVAGNGKTAAAGGKQAPNSFPVTPVSPGGSGPSPIPSLPALPGLGGGGQDLPLVTPTGPADKPGTSPPVLPPSPECGDTSLWMRLVDWRTPKFCMDMFEYPNRPGAMPVACMTYFEAKQFCSDAGKRLCTRSEWLAACGGPTKLNYPYGNSRPASMAPKDRHCNEGAKIYRETNFKKITQKTSPWAPDSPNTPHGGDVCGMAYQVRLQTTTSVTPFCSFDSQLSVNPQVGIYDLAGNVFEILEDPHPNTTVQGGYWIRCAGENPNLFPGCNPECLNRGHPKGFRSYEWGTRCCKDVPSSPVTPPANNRVVPPNNIVNNQPQGTIPSLSNLGNLIPNVFG